MCVCMHEIDKLRERERERERESGKEKDKTKKLQELEETFVSWERERQREDVKK